MKTCCKVVTLTRLPAVEVPGEVVPLTFSTRGGLCRVGICFVLISSAQVLTNLKSKMPPNWTVCFVIAFVFVNFVANTVSFVSKISEYRERVAEMFHHSFGVYIIILNF